MPETIKIGNHRILTRGRSNAISVSGSVPQLLLDVPLVGQVQQMDCWYAGVCMLAYYRAPGPRLGLPKAWRADRGIQSSAWGRLALVEGLKPVAHKSPSHTATKWDLFIWLRDYGPLWCAGDWFGFGHVIVLTGISGDTIYLNDPDDGVGGPDGSRKTNTVAWFNSHMYWSIQNSLLYKPV